MKKKKWLIIAVTLLFIVCSGTWLVRTSLYALGNFELYKLALDKNYCESKNCNEGIRDVVNELQKKTGVDAKDIPWCMASNAIYTSDYGFLNPIKNKFSDWIYNLYCHKDEITLDDANITIGEPHSHDGQDMDDDDGNENSDSE